MEKKREPKTNAERQKAYRERQKNTSKGREINALARERYNRRKILIEEMRTKKEARPTREKVPELEKKKKQIAALKKRIKVLVEGNANYRRKIEMYKKRWTRMKEKEKNVLLKTPDSQLSPKSKTKKQLLKLSSAEKITMLPKVLLIQNSIMESLREKYKEIRSRSDKKSLQEAMSSKIIKKYRLQKEVTRQTGLDFRSKECSSGVIKKLNTENRLHEFYIRDDVSRATAGPKECLTKKKQKYQKRYLLDKLEYLHKKFNREYPDARIGFSTFARYRPFYVLRPAAEDRNTVLCKTHANFKEKIDKLRKIKKIVGSSIREIIKKSVCNTENITCAYNVCPGCKNRSLMLSPENENENYQENENINYHEWVNVKEERVKNTAKGTKTFQVTFVKKELKKASVKELEEKVNKELIPMKKHVFNIDNQQKWYQTLKEKLQNTEAIIHCDFSENYSCKLSEEIQSYHFGASRNQASLHTSVIYVKDMKPISVCTVSGNLEHGPHAIWAHLTPLLNYLKNDLKINLEILHVFSDGPASQYRQKLNFYLHRENVTKFNINHGTWSFFESGHGKGAADGIGAAVKRAADGLVAKGTDIEDAKSLYENLKEQLNVKLFYIESEEIEKVKKSLPEDLVAIKGTNTIHQLYTNGKIFKYRELSCYCDKNKYTGSEAQLCDCTFCFKNGSFIRKSEIKEINTGDPQKQQPAKRGRKRKIETEDKNRTNNNSSKNNVEEKRGNEAQEPMKKRGRKKKIETEDKNRTNNNSKKNNVEEKRGNEAQEPVKKRGRKKKIETQDENQNNFL